MSLIVSIEAVVVSVLVTVMSILASVSGDEFIIYLERNGQVFSSVIRNLRFVISVNGISVLLCFFHQEIVDPMSAFSYRLYETVAIGFAAYAITSAVLVVYEMIHFAENRAAFLRGKSSGSSESEQQQSEE